MFKTKLAIASTLGVLLAGTAVSANYEVSIVSNGLNEYAATKNGIGLVVGSPFQPATPIYNGCSNTANTPIAPTYVQETQDESLAFAIFTPICLPGVLVEFGITNHGLYERYNSKVDIFNNPGAHHFTFSSLTIGPQHSVEIFIVTPEDSSSNEVAIYNNELQGIALLTASEVTGIPDLSIVSVNLDPKGVFFYVCTENNMVTQFRWETPTNPLVNPQSVLPVPYERVFQSSNPLIVDAFCQ